MFFHVDPRDRDGLLAYTYNQDRESGLLEIPGTVGKEISKHKTKKCSRSERKKDQNGNNPTYKYALVILQPHARSKLIKLLEQNSAQKLTKENDKTISRHPLSYSRTIVTIQSLAITCPQTCFAPKQS